MTPRLNLLEGYLRGKGSTHKSLCARLYYWNNRDRLRTAAKDRAKEKPGYNARKSREWRAAHPRAHIEPNRDARRARTDELNQIKLAAGCRRCAYNESPAALHFHHLKDKSFTVSNKKGVSRKALLEEIGKCVVLCANCHARLHAGELACPSA